MNIIKKLALIIGVVASVFGMIWSVFSYICPPLPEKADHKLNGIWYGEFRYPIPTGNLAILGTVYLIQSATCTELSGRSTRRLHKDVRELCVPYQLS